MQLVPDPILATARRLAQLPRRTKFAIERRAVTLAVERTERLDPILIKLMTDEPITPALAAKTPTILTELLILVKALIDRVLPALPTWDESESDIARVSVKRPVDLTLTLLPALIISSTVTEDDRRPRSRSEKLLPSTR
jgi:hypothetical protein